MRHLFSVLAQALVCSLILAAPVRALAEDQQAPPQEQERQTAADMDPQFEDQLAKEVESMPNFETSPDMKQALHELPEEAGE